MMGGPVPQGTEGFVVKIDVGEGGEQPVGEEIGDLPVSPLGGAESGQPGQMGDELVLDSGGLRLLAADAGADTAAAARRLLALEAKHF